MIYKYGRANIRSSKVYHLLQEHVGGYENISAPKRLHIIFIDMLKKKMGVDPSFLFDYQVDEEN